MNVWRTLNANLTRNQGIFDFFFYLQTNGFRYYECRCNKGFQGDGIDCTESSSSGETISRSSVEKNSQRKECVDAIE